MQKTGLFIVIFVLAFALFSTSFVLAESDNQREGALEGRPPDFDDSENILDDPEFADAELNTDGGTMPDSVFYAIDKFFDRFADEGDVRQERIAEFRAMIAAGKYEEAREAIRDYARYADEFERNVNPTQRDEARRSASAIRNALRDLEDEIPEDIYDDYFEDIIEHEEGIATAAEIANKINTLCRQLAEIDPNLFYDSCRVDDDGPKWQKEMFDDLTEEQIKEAKNFGKIMAECFSTSGQNCRCDEIPFTAFANACSKAAPLATACDIDRDEAACEQLDDLEMPELPPHLQHIMDELEGEINDEKFDVHMPEECVKAGISMGDRDAREKCSRIMIETGAPPECRQALLDANVQSEFEGREICDRIMMEIHAPECFEQGITDPRECEKFYRENGPEMERRGSGLGGPGFDINCREIEDPMERLDCFDKASSQTQSFHGGFDDENYEGPCMTERDWAAKKQECRSLYGEHAGDEPVYGDSGEGYECVIDATCIDFGQYKEDFGEDWRAKEQECAASCDLENGWWDFRDGECICKTNDFQERGVPPGGWPWQCEEADTLTRESCERTMIEWGERERERDRQEREGDGGEGEGDTSSGTTEITTSGEGGEGGGEPALSESPPAESEPIEDSGSIITGNAFLDYWYNH